MAALTVSQQAKHSATTTDALVTSAKELRTVPLSNFRRASSVEMVQLVPRAGAKTLPDAPKPGAPDAGQQFSGPLTSIQTDVVLRLSQESHKNKVFEIDLSGNAIKKIENVEAFTHLRILDLACNHIERIENLSKNSELRELRLYANRLTKLENLQDLKKLAVLKLQQNFIEQIGESTLAQLKQLETLRLDSNRLRVIKQVELLPLTASLRVLNLSSNQLNDVSAVACLQRIETLDLSHNNIPQLPNFKKCPGLIELNISHNRLDSLSGLSENVALITLDCSFNAFKNLKSLGPSKKSLENLFSQSNLLENFDDVPLIAPNLEILDISKNRIRDSHKLFSSLQRFDQLVELKCLDNPCFETANPYDLRNLIPNIEMINGTNFSKRSFAPTGDPASVRPQTPSARGQRPPLVDSQDLSSTALSSAIMRPKTASTGLTIRQIDSTFNNMDVTMVNLEKSFIAAFQKVCSTLDTEAPKCTNPDLNEQCRTCRLAKRKQMREENDKKEDDATLLEKERENASSRLSVPPSPSPSQKSSPPPRNALTRRLDAAKNFSQKISSSRGSTGSGGASTPPNLKTTLMSNSNSSPSLRSQASTQKPPLQVRQPRQNSATRKS